MFEAETLRLRPVRAPAFDRVTESTGRTAAAAANLAELAVPRLRSLSILLAVLSGLFAVGAVAARAADLESPINSEFQLGIALVAFVASCAMACVTRLAWPAARVANIGIAFQIVGALCISLIDDQIARQSGIAIVGVWIMSFTLVPRTPWHATLAAFGAASTSAVGIAVNHALGHRSDDVPGVIVAVVIGNVLCATIAVFTNQVIYRLGRDIEDVKQLGAYNLVEKLGHGGMGEVWRAEHRALIRPAAIKLMRPEMMRTASAAEVEAMRSRFETEVQSTALLTSPHTVAVYDFGSTDDGRLYYVMELLHGLDVETVVRRHGPLPAERVVALLRQACESLGEAHANGLVHRDIKPANLYLCTIGRQVDFLKVLDFGLVRDLASGTRLTGEGVVSGTPAYLAPETAAHNVTDERSDIYARGCVAYWMLTGTLVFEAETAPAMMAAHLRDAVTPPSARTELVIPRELDAIVMACLEKDPAARPQSMDELRRRLDAVALDEAWTAARAAGWWDVHAPDVIREASHTRRRELCAVSAGAGAKRGAVTSRA